MKIRLKEFIGPRCITAEQGLQLLNEIQPRLLSKEMVIIDLEGVKTLMSLFLNNAIGPLFKHFDQRQLSELLKFENAASSQKLTLDLVLKNAESYHRDPAMREAVDDALAKMLEEMD